VVVLKKIVNKPGHFPIQHLTIILSMGQKKDLLVEKVWTANFAFFIYVSTIDIRKIDRLSYWRQYPAFVQRGTLPFDS